MAPTTILTFPSFLLGCLEFAASLLPIVLLAYLCTSILSYHRKKPADLQAFCTLFAYLHVFTTLFVWFFGDGKEQLFCWTLACSVAGVWIVAVAIGLLLLVGMETRRGFAVVFGEGRVRVGDEEQGMGMAGQWELPPRYVDVVAEGTSDHGEETGCAEADPAS